MAAPTAQRRPFAPRYKMTATATSTAHQRTANNLTMRFSMNGSHQPTPAARRIRLRIGSLTITSSSRASVSGVANVKGPTVGDNPTPDRAPAASSAFNAAG